MRVVCTVNGPNAHHDIEPNVTAIGKYRTSEHAARVTKNRKLLFEVWPQKSRHASATRGKYARNAAATQSNARRTQTNQTGPESQAPSDVHCPQKLPLVARAVVCR